MQNKQRFIADQRWDKPQYDSMLQFIEAEFQAYAKLFITPSKKIVQNWLVEDAGGLDIRVNNGTDSTLFNTERVGKEDFYRKLTTETQLTLTLPDNAVSFVEVELFEKTCADDNVAVWDITANAGIGEEFVQNSDLITRQEMRLVSNVTAFTSDPEKLKLATVTTAGGVITGIVDGRVFLFDADAYAFGAPRTDQGIGNLKEMYDALTTILLELKGTVEWYDELGSGASAIGLLERLNYILVDGGNITWDATPDEATWSLDLKIVAPGQAFNYVVSAQSVAGILDGEVIYVTLPDVGVAPGGALAVSKASSSAYLLDAANTRNYILAYRSGTKLYFGNGWQGVELESGEINQLGDGITAAWITATGLTDEQDSTPPYSSTFIITPFGSFTLAISELDTAVDTLFGFLAGLIYDEKVVLGAPLGAAAEITLPGGQAYEVGANSVEVWYDGIFKCIGAGNDYEEVDDGGGVGTKIKLVYGLATGVIVRFRIQVGGSGALGGAGLDIEDEGILISVSPGRLNFTGPGVTAVETSPGVVAANILGIPTLVEFDVAAPTTDFLTGTPIAAPDYIEVYVDGVEKREGGANDYTRDTVLDKIVFNSALLAGVFVRIKLFI